MDEAEVSRIVERAIAEDAHKHPEDLAAKLEAVTRERDEARNEAKRWSGHNRHSKEVIVRQSRRIEALTRQRDEALECLEAAKGMPATAYVLRALAADWDKHKPEGYPVPFRVMWDQAAALDELTRIAKEEFDKKSGITFSLVECECDAPPPATCNVEYATKPHAIRCQLPLGHPRPVREDGVPCHAGQDAEGRIVVFGEGQPCAICGGSGVTYQPNSGMLRNTIACPVCQGGE